MKRFHVHVSVENLTESVRFYSTLFASQPTVLKTDYAKWMLEDPRVNFAVSQRGAKLGVEHVGIQVENRDELAEVWGRLNEAERPVFNEGATTCCYAQSEKLWINDPQGVTWETFLTTGESTVYGAGAAGAVASDAAVARADTERADNARKPEAACCAPTCCSPSAEPTT
jgi:hypothetical protein